MQSRTAYNKHTQNTMFIMLDYRNIVYYTNRYLNVLEFKV